MAPHPYRRGNYRCGCGVGVNVRIAADPPAMDLCAVPGCTLRPSNRIVVALCAEHHKLAVVALAPEALHTYGAQDWEDLRADYLASFGISLTRPRPRPSKVTVEDGEVVYTAARPSVLDEHLPVVYFAIVGDQVKIGTSTNLRRRLGAMIPPTAEVLIVPGSYSEEAQFHSRYRDERLQSSEWFRMSPRLRGDLDNMVRQGRAKPRYMVERTLIEGTPRIS